MNAPDEYGLQKVCETQAAQVAKTHSPCKGFEHLCLRGHEHDGRKECDCCEHVCDSVHRLLLVGTREEHDAKTAASVRIKYLTRSIGDWVIEGERSVCVCVFRCSPWTRENECNVTRSPADKPFSPAL